MTSGLDRRALALIAILSAGLLLAATQVSDGFFIIDEVMYFIGADAFARSGSFTIQNGFEQFASDNLRLWLLSEGPSGLTPQYPIGTTLAAAPLIPLFGSKTLIALNVIGGIATLFVTYALAIRLFDSRQVATLSILFLSLYSFWPEYVLGHWPHSSSIFAANATLLLFLIALDGHRLVFPIAVLAGITVGVGMFFRLEVILLLPAITAIAILYAPRPVVLLSGGILGFLPMLGLMAVANEIRFGSYMPLSYGSTGGATVASRYVIIGAVLVCALAGLIILRLRGGLGRIERGIVAALGLLGLAALALSPYGSVLTKLAQGIYALFIDATTINDPRAGVLRDSDGTLLFWGLPKKALAQSMPWLGCLVLLIGVASRQHKRSIFIALIIIIIWSLPFVLRSWHGGLGSNMRYFLPVLPLLAILAGHTLCTLYEKAEFQSLRLPFIFGMLGFGFALSWLLLIDGRAAYLHQFVSLGVFGIATLGCLLSALMPQRQMAAAALGLTCIALGQAAALNIDDLTSAQLRRTHMANLSNQHAPITGPVVIFAEPETVSHAFAKQDQLVALAHPVKNTIDIDLITQACQAGHRILLAAHMKQQFVSAGFSTQSMTLAPDVSSGRFLDLACPA